MVRGGGASARADELSETKRPRLAAVRDDGQARGATLTGKERTVMAKLASGATTDEIATLLVVSPHTVRSHIKNGMRKLQASTRAHAVAIALSDGVIAFDRGEGRSG